MNRRTRRLRKRRRSLLTHLEYTHAPKLDRWRQRRVPGRLIYKNPPDVFMLEDVKNAVELLRSANVPVVDGYYTFYPPMPRHFQTMSRWWFERFL